MPSSSKPPLIPTPSSVSPPLSLPLPRALRKNRSFAQLTRFLGISSHDADDSGSEDGADDDRTFSGDEGDGDPCADVDEESLMWDAQTALIAHQPALAAKYYATAALPPFRSSTACLALGNLLARGSGLSQPDSEPTSPLAEPPKSPVARSPQVSWFTSFFRSEPEMEPPESPEQSRRPSLITNGWSMPTDGKRAVRDVEGMGKAGGWLILGIGWIIDAEPIYSVRAPPARIPEDGMIVYSKGKQRPPVPNFAPAASTSSSEDSFDLSTPDDDDLVQGAGEKIKLLYNLLIPLLHLYRHGHIQHHDPVALPPLAASQLPLVLRPQGDNEKGRNVWSLGSIVATKVLQLQLLSCHSLTKDELSKRDGIIIVCNYIRGITSSSEIAEESFRTVLRCRPSGLEVPDDLIYQAYRRLNSILKATGGVPLSPTDESFPAALIRSSMNSLRRRPSASSLLSFADSMVHSSLRLRTPVKSSASLASLSFEPSTAPLDPEVDDGAAIRSLHNLQRTQERILAARQKPQGPPVSRAWWPSLRGWKMNTAPLPPVQQESPRMDAQDPPVRAERLDINYRRDKGKGKAPLREVASSPQLRRRLPFEPTHAVAAVDPELAALELASALTKHVTCNVCGAGGVNFPNCRKCGLTFCSRKCRVDEKGAGDGKRHVCGAWESRNPEAAKLAKEKLDKTPVRQPSLKNLALPEPLLTGKVH